MLRLVKGMVAETNDVWDRNRPNIDYRVSQQSLVYIKHSPVTGRPAGVILIIRWRNMALALCCCCCCRSHKTQPPVLSSRVHFLIGALCNLATNKKQKKTKQTMLRPSGECRIILASHACVFKRFAWYGAGWWVSYLRLVVWAAWTLHPVLIRTWLHAAF